MQAASFGDGPKWRKRKMAVALAKSLLDSPSLSTSTLGALSSALATVRSAAAAGHWLAATFVRLLPGKPSCRRRSKRGIEVHLLKVGPVATGHPVFINQRRLGRHECTIRSMLRPYTAAQPVTKFI